MAEDPAVDRVEWSAYRIPTEAPEADGTITWSATTMVVVHAHAAGRTGLGWTYAPTAAGHLIGEILAAAVTGRAALDVPGSYEAMHRAVRNAGRPGIAACAISAVDVALWDLKARLLDLRLARLFGAVRAAVPVYASGGFTTQDGPELAGQLSGWAERGFTRYKIKIGESWGAAEGRDLARVFLARDVIGDGAELFVDANGGYTRKQAVRVGRRLADADVVWFEEPVSSDDLAGLREIRAAVTPDVAAGEYGYELTYYGRLAGAVDVLQADATRCGGYTEWARIAALAAAHNLQLSAHCAPNLHVDAGMATVNLRHLEWFADHDRIESMLLDGAVPVEAGEARPDPSRPGHGLTFRHPDAEPYRVA